jgi:predicted RNA-binding Zn-ribbon protein involved in translation (DUF1610 family)
MGIITTFRIEIVLCVYLLGSSTFVLADGAPPPPIDPKSTDECRVYQSKHIEYMKTVQQSSKACSDNGWKMRDPKFVTFVPSCGGAAITSFENCKQLSDAAWCSIAGFGQKYGSCMKKAIVSERRPLDNALEKNEQQRGKEAFRLLRETCASETALPKPEACKGLKPLGSGLEE